MSDATSVGPVAQRERIADIDVLRGAALFGVFLVNLTGFGAAGIMATEGQLAALPTAPVDRAVSFAIDWLVADKANTMFAFLFGLGFYIQMERGLARDPGFARVYARRIAILALFGWAHLVFLWTWDILHLYGMVGFALLAMRRVSDRALLAIGLPLLLIDGHLLEWGLGALGIGGGGADFYADAAVLARQAADYPQELALTWRWTWIDYIVNGQLVAWMIYALGRFAMGAWVGRKGWIQRPDAAMPGFRRALVLCLPLGLALSLLARLLEAQLLGPAFAGEAWGHLGSALRPAAAALLAAGYLCGVMVALRSAAGRPLLAPLRHVGQMALTNYVTQSFVIAFVLFGIGPGLGLAGRIGTAWLAAIAIAGFVAQVALSRLWLSRFAFGPLEWAWRALTYGRRPRFRRAAALAAA